MNADRSGGAPDRIERKLLKALLTPPIPQGGGQVGREPPPSPDHGRKGSAELREMADGVTYIGIGEVAEHSARQHEVRGHRTGIGRGRSGVAEDKVHSRKAPPGNLVPTGGDELRSNVHETCTNVVASGMIDKCP